MLFQTSVSQIVTSQIVNCLALAFNMAGTYILFFRGFPQPNFDTEIYMSLEDATRLSDGLTVDEHKQKIEKKKSAIYVFQKLA